MKQTMKVAISQWNLLWADPEANVKKADQALAAVPEADLYVLPEMFSTGFCTEPEGIAEGCEPLGLNEDLITSGTGPKGPKTLQWMLSRAAQKNCALAGSFAIKEEGRFFNRFYFVCPDGKFASYDKRHLFTYGGEDKRFTSGKERVIVPWKGVRILLQVCYDLRFPVFCRNRGDYDMIIYVASWPSSRIEVWKTLLRARAIENQCFVVGVNRIGTDPSCEYCGGSAIIDAYGRTLAHCPDGEESTVAAELNMEALTEFRKKFPVLEDGDGFELAL